MEPNIVNFHKVSDTLYRSAQPTEEQMRQLELFGIKTVVNLRQLHSDLFKIEGTTLKYFRIRAAAWHPEKEDAVEFLRIATNPENQPVLVHCQHGADRTGMMCALYRIVVEGWNKTDAINEMLYGGFGFHGIFSMIWEWIEIIDIEGIKKELGISINEEVSKK